MNAVVLQKTPNQKMPGQSKNRLLQVALQHHQAGRLPQAGDIYRKILQNNPNHADALHLLGTLYHQTGNNELAVEFISRAIRIDPANPFFHDNLGTVYQALNSLDDAAACYQNVLALEPGYAGAHFNLGNVLNRQGQPDKAAACYQKALALHPNYVDAYISLGNTFKDLGKLDEAIACYQKTLAFNPNYAEVHFNLGIALQEQGKLDEAINSYRRALSLKPDYAEAYSNLGVTFQKLGKLEEAINSFHRALTLEPEWADAYCGLASALLSKGDAFSALETSHRSFKISGANETKALIFQCLKQVNFSRDHADFRQLVIRAISEPWGRPCELAGVSASLIMSNPDIGACIKRAMEAWPARLPALKLFGHSGLASASADHLLQCLLENAQICDLELERFLTMVRYSILDAAANAEISAGIDVNVLTFYSALARQCFINEYIFSCTDEEFGLARLLREQLAADIASGAAISPLRIVAVAAYFPLYSLPAASALLEQSWPACVTALLVQQVQEPLKEQQYRTAIPRITPIENDISRLVQQQYEENPYPRWMKPAPSSNESTFDTFLRNQFPLMPFTPLGKNNGMEILVAGCGTGRQPIERAQQFPRAKILAVDLSLSSLCYAQRKTFELGLVNIEYAQADIMKLGTIGRKFDLIESVGVLHHLANPLEGWRELLSMLRPGGIMYLGFYSECARQHVVAARGFIAEHGYAPNAADIRRCREHLLSMQDRMEFNQVTSSPDFYGTSGCRDLLFHVQEHRFTLPQLKKILGELGLDFIGFTLDRHAFIKYRERFPDDYPMIDLDRWNVFENENQNTFGGMYQFYVQKRSS